ncbi:hypothetical protein Dimus_034978 [Dionaea muscipula]
MALVKCSDVADQRRNVNNNNALEMRPLMLKDYLSYDAGSCSSTGFRSFPRHECCVAVRNLIQFEANWNLIRIRSRTASASGSGLISKLERASMEVIKAVKLLPFKSPAAVFRRREEERKYLQLPRSLSRKIFRRKLWWRSGRGGCEVVERWISAAGIVAGDGEECGKLSSPEAMIGAPADISEFDPSSCLHCTNRNDVVEGEECSSVKKVGEMVGVTVCGVAIDAAAERKKNWGNDQNKEQFSPVSVFDFSDETEEGTSSPFTCSLAGHFEGTQQKLVQKLARISYVDSQVEPVNLITRFEPSLAEDESTKPDIHEFISFKEEGKKTHETKHKAKHLVNRVKEKVPRNKYDKFKPDNLLIDFFEEGIDDNSESSLLKVAEDWLNGCYDKLLLGWEVKQKRQAYVRDMEEGRRWRIDEEKEEIAIKLAAEVSESLTDEMLLEICFCDRPM